MSIDMFETMALLKAQSDNYERWSPFAAQIANKYKIPASSDPFSGGEFNDERQLEFRELCKAAGIDVDAEWFKRMGVRHSGGGQFSHSVLPTQADRAWKKIEQANNDVARMRQEGFTVEDTNRIHKIADDAMPVFEAEGDLLGLALSTRLFLLASDLIGLIPLNAAVEMVGYFEQHGKDQNLVTGYYDCAVFHAKSGKFDTAREYAQKALDLGEELSVSEQEMVVIRRLLRQMEDRIAGGPPAHPSTSEITPEDGAERADVAAESASALAAESEDAEDRASASATGTGAEEDTIGADGESRAEGKKQDTQVTQASEETHGAEGGTAHQETLIDQVHEGVTANITDKEPDTEVAERPDSQERVGRSGRWFLLWGSLGRKVATVAGVAILVVAIAFIATKGHMRDSSEPARTTTARVPPAAHQRPTTNIALNKPVTASSYFSKSYAPGHVTDGKATRRAGGSWASKGETRGAWVQIDLGGTYAVEEVRITSRFDGAVSRADKYRNIEIVLSDGVTFRHQLKQTAKSQSIRFPSSHLTSTVRINCLSSYNPAYNPGFAEIEVLGYSP